MARPQKAIILVAGEGKRMKPLTDQIPKCLIEVKGKKILINALESLEENGVGETVLVVGHLEDQVREVAGDRLKGMKISYIKNNLYDTTNSGYSLWLAIKDLKEDLLILEGDIFFEKSLLKEFIEDERANLTIVEKYKPWHDGTFVEIGDDGSVLSWIHKKDRPKAFALEDKYKTVNIHRFSSSFIREWIIPLLKRQIEKKWKAEPVETLFNEIVKNKGKIYAFDTRGKLWAEVDDSADLEIAQELFRQK